MNSPECFAISRIAQELGRSRQHVYLGFAGIRPDGETFVRGQRAAGWLPASFPKTIFDELQAIRIRKHFRSIADLLSAAPTRWSPPFPFVEAAPAEQERALRL